MRFVSWVCILLFEYTLGSLWRNRDEESEGGEKTLSAWQVAECRWCIMHSVVSSWKKYNALLACCPWKLRGMLENCCGVSTFWRLKKKIMKKMLFLRWKCWSALKFIVSLFFVSKKVFSHFKIRWLCCNHNVWKSIFGIKMCIRMMLTFDNDLETKIQRSVVEERGRLNAGKQTMVNVVMKRKKIEMRDCVEPNCWPAGSACCLRDCKLSLRMQTDKQDRHHFTILPPNTETASHASRSLPLFISFAAPDAAAFFSFQLSPVHMHVYELPNLFSLSSLSHCSSNSFSSLLMKWVSLQHSLPLIVQWFVASP